MDPIFDPMVARVLVEARRQDLRRLWPSDSSAPDRPSVRQRLGRSLIGLGGRIAGPPVGPGAPRPAPAG
ncbi:MAG TPA: hypothetical protein VFN57_18700 [Thermomicrobiaceae bacterium]|nr:hypothetical protein [Thermomicrobiaceae bacterium]